MKTIPPAHALTRKLREIAEDFGVTIQTAMKWRLARGLKPNPKGGPKGTKPASFALWGHITPDDWAKGLRHVAGLLGVTHQRASQIRQRLRAAGRVIPDALHPARRKSLAPDGE